MSVCLVVSLVLLAAAVHRPPDASCLLARRLPPPTRSTIASHKSQNLIVRASNPGQFENEPSVNWIKGSTMSSVYHNGAVGINTDSPDEALCVQGNIRLSGAILQPSDRRVKTDIVELDPSEQLKTLRKLSLYRYQLTQEWADTCGRGADEMEDVGVLAQELAVALPDAVKGEPLPAARCPLAAKLPLAPPNFRSNNVPVAPIPWHAQPLHPQPLTPTGPSQSLATST